MVNVTASINQADVARLEHEMTRARVELGKTVRDSIDWAGRFVSKSLSASTKTAPKLRKIVRNPDKRYKTDRRFAPWGVMAPKGPERVMAFRPIYRTGEYGIIRFFDKKSMSWFDRWGTGKWEKLPSGPDVANPHIVAPGIMTDKRRVIGRRGLAKRAWSWSATHISSGGASDLGGYGAKIDVRWFNLFGNTTLRIKNYLKYAQLAFRSKGNTVDTVLLRAAGAMSNRIDDRIKRRVANAK